ncbi:MAG: hypothetical protein ACE15F_21085 [bacterium]
MAKTESKRRVTLSGVITAADWDEEGQVVNVMISATDESDYIIGQNDKGFKLLNLIQKQVQVTGVVGEDDSGRKMIMVTKYQVIREYDTRDGSMDFMT